MPPYSGPSKEHSEYRSKFVRVVDKVFVTDPNDLKTAHVNQELEEK